MGEADQKSMKQCGNGSKLIKKSMKQSGNQNKLIKKGTVS